MKMLIQEACQGPVRDAFKASAGALAELRAEELRPVVLRDFQVGAGGRCVGSIAACGWGGVHRLPAVQWTACLTQSTVACGAACLFVHLFNQ
jgi:hypothetical protein